MVEDAAQSQGARRHGVQRRRPGPRRGHQLLPRQEPRRVRRRRCRAHQFRGVGGADADDRGTTGRRGSTSMRCSASTAGSTPCRPSCCRRSCGGSPAGTRPGGRRPTATIELLAGCDAVSGPRTLDGNEHVWHLYAVRVPDRDRVLKELHAAGIGAGIHYPAPIHLTAAFADLDTGRRLPGRRAYGGRTAEPADLPGDNPRTAAARGLGADVGPVAADRGWPRPERPGSSVSPRCRAAR